MMALLSFAQDFEVKNADGKTIYYNITSSSDLTVAVTCKGTYGRQYSNEYSGDVTIPESVSYGGKTYSVTSIGNSAFYECSGLTSITIPNSVTSIDYDAFWGTAWYDNQPNGLVYAGKVAYKYKGTMPSNTKIALKEGTLGISGKAFYGCSSLTSIEIPNSVTSIGQSAFYECSGLTSVTIPNSVTTIGYRAFSGCSGLTSITIPNSVTSIGTEAFSSCSGLTSVTIPNSVTSISGSAFEGCSGLTSVEIPNSVTSISGSAFYGCSGLTSITIPNSVTSIGDWAFDGCSGLTSIEIPNSVTSIGGSAFEGCSGLTSVEIPNGVTSISGSAFEGCSGLTSVTIPNSVTSIYNGAFEGCSGLTSVTIPNSVTSISGSAFEGCSGLTSVTIPNSVKFIGTEAFSSCSGLTSVTINSNSIISKTYSSESNLSNIFGSQVKSYIIGDGVTSIGNYEFYGCSGLTSVEIPNSVTSIGSFAFDGCSGLSSVILPDNIIRLYSNSFPSSTKLYVNIGTKTLLELWSCETYSNIYNKETKQEITKPTLSASATQATLKVFINEMLDGYTYTCDGKIMTDNVVFDAKGLMPGYSTSFSVKISLDDINYYSFNQSCSTYGLDPSVKGVSASASSINATSSYSTGDAKIIKHELSCNGKKVEGNKISLNGLNPNTSYKVVYTITAAYGENNEKTATYTTESEIKTSKLTMTTEQPKVVSVGNVIVSAKANVDDAETNVGFEWRRTDWTYDFKSNTGTAYMYEGTMEGYIRNLYAEKLWKFRPYYLADDGTYYYGNWMGLDPTNTSYFEPTVHTYANINVEGNTALVKGYALGGTDKITVQGFKYWKAANLAPSGDLALEARKASPAIPIDAQTIEAEGRVMEATLSGLDYECTYSYVAFAKTDEGTFYGDIKTFTTGPNTTGIEVLRDADSDTKAVDDKVKGIYTLTGVKLSDDAADLKTLKRGIYIVNGRKVAVK